MDEWHVYDSLTGEHFVIEDEFLLWQYLNSLASTAGVLVKHFQKIHKDTRAYGQLPGASPLPPKPSKPPKSKTVAINHIKPVTP